MKKLTLLMIGCILALVINVSRAAEVWIRPDGTDNTGNGSAGNPYVRSTATSFNALMLTIPENSTIRLMAGTFRTDGGPAGPRWALKTGQKLIGSGIDVTTIKLSDGIPGDGRYVIPSWPSQEGIEVRDLTVDCNSPGSGTYSGVGLEGTRCAIRRVKVIHASHQSGVSSESFTLHIQAPSGTDSDGNIIEDCEVSQFVGTGAISCINVAAYAGRYISGVIRGNRIYLPGWGMGINAVNSRNLLIHGNYIHGANSGLYSDTGRNTNLTFSHNIVKDVQAGIYLANAEPHDTISILYNRLELGNFSGPDAMGVLLWAAAPGRWKNVTVIGNSIRREPWMDPSASLQSISLYGVDGAIVQNNIAESNMVSQLSGSTGIHGFSNRDFSGNLLPYLNENPNTIRKIADESITSDNSLDDDSTLKFTMSANTKYRIRLKVFFATGATPDFKYQITGPAATLVRRHIIRAAGGLAPAMLPIFIGYDPAGVPLLGGPGTEGFIEEEIIVYNAGTAGDFVFRWAQDTSTASATLVRAGSYIEYMPF